MIALRVWAEACNASPSAAGAAVTRPKDVCVPKLTELTLKERSQFR